MKGGSAVSSYSSLLGGAGAWSFRPRRQVQGWRLQVLAASRAPSHPWHPKGTCTYSTLPAPTNLRHPPAVLQVAVQFPRFRPVFAKSGRQVRQDNPSISQDPRQDSNRGMTPAAAISEPDSFPRSPPAPMSADSWRRGLPPKEISEERKLRPEHGVHVVVYGEDAKKK